MTPDAPILPASPCTPEQSACNTLREAVVFSARKCLGTPFIHQGRKPGIGLDCAGLLLQVAKELGLPQQDYARRDYSRFPLLGKHLFDFVAGQTTQVASDKMQKGCILMFWIARPDLPQHLGIYTSHGRMIHAWSDAKRVTECYLGPYWTERHYATFEFYGVMP